MARRLNSEFQRAARKDKEAYWEQQCKQLEADCIKGHTRNAFAQVKRIRAPFMPRKGTIKDKEGKELTDQQGILNRWREYTEELYSSSSEPPLPSEGRYDEAADPEPDILDEEVVWAVKQLQNNKAPGIDTIPAELLKAIPPMAITALCRKI